MMRPRPHGPIFIRLGDGLPVCKAAARSFHFMGRMFCNLGHSGNVLRGLRLRVLRAKHDGALRGGEFAPRARARR